MANTKFLTNVDIIQSNLTLGTIRNPATNEAYAINLLDNNSIIAFGDNSATTQNVLVGEYGTTDTDQLWMHGKSGSFFTTDGGANEVPTIAMVIDSSARVGIGTTNPGVKLEVVDSINAQLEVSGYSEETNQANAANGLMFIGNNSLYRGVIDYNASSTSDLIISNTYDNAISGIRFKVSTSGDGGIDAMKIKGNGNVGIGTTTPNAKLEVDVVSGDGILINSADVATIKMKGGGSANWGFATTNLASGDFGIYKSNASGGDPISAGTPQLYIKSNGNIGIDTTNPNSLLTIGGNVVSTSKPTAVISDTTNGGSLVLRGVSPILSFDKTGTGIPKILMDSGGVQFKTGTLDAEGDIDMVILPDGGVTIGKGQLVLGGTGRIQGVDTVSSSTDAANKAYVDAAITTPGNGQIDGRTSGNGLSGSMDATANQSGNTTFTVASNATTAATANTIAYRNGSADIFARLFRSSYSNQSTISGGIAFRVNNGSDNYIRFCNNAPNIRTFISAASTSVVSDNVAILTTGNRKGLAITTDGTEVNLGLNINGLATKGSPQNWDISSVTLLAYDGDETDDNVQIEIADLLSLAGNLSGSGTSGFIAGFTSSGNLGQTSLYNGSTGRVNINNTFTGNPQAGGDADLFITGSATNSAACIVLMNSDVSGSTNQETGRIEFGIKDDNTQGYINTRILSRLKSTPGTGSPGKGQLEFQTSQGSTGNSPLTRMTIDGLGNVGINDTTPAEKLQVNGNIRAGGYKSSDGSTGITGTFTFVDKASATRSLTIKNGLITAKT